MASAGKLLGGGASVPSAVGAWTNTAQVYGSATAALNTRDMGLASYTGTVTGGGNTLILIDSGLYGPEDNWKGRSLIFKSGALAGQPALIQAYNVAAKQLTFNAALTGNATNGATYVIV